MVKSWNLWLICPIPNPISFSLEFANIYNPKCPNIPLVIQEIEMDRIFPLECIQSDCKLDLTVVYNLLSPEYSTPVMMTSTTNRRNKHETTFGNLNIISNWYVGDEDGKMVIRMRWHRFLVVCVQKLSIW